MSSAELLEAMTAQLGELEPRDVLRLQSRVSRLAHHVRMEGPEFRRRWAAGVEVARSRNAARAGIAGTQGTG